MSEDLLDYLYGLADRLSKLENKPINIIDGNFIELDHLNKLPETPKLAKTKEDAAKEAAFRASVLHQKISKEISNQVSNDDIVDKYIERLAEHIFGDK